MTKVVVVDDDQSNTTLIKMLLELDGFTVDTFTTVKDAKTMATADTAAFVVDFYLTRDESGLELLQAIRGEETAVPPQTVVIMTSGDYRREEDALAGGADLFLFKPYPPDSLAKEINRLLSRSA